MRANTHRHSCSAFIPSFDSIGGAWRDINLSGLSLIHIDG